ncbi:MAG: 30S ribosomal protein S12 methylthiotransferase RimO [Bacteroidales bacterium]|nr:30S ribosomal protein S12 methylthiotransferase RimO [Bacteroidales bacterium]
MAKIAKKINIITLGCSKNLVDSEQFAALAVKAGYRVEHNSHKKDFEIAFVNTCGFINDAKEESINTILELTELKAEGKLEKIIVFGCLAERYMTELKNEIPEVDIYSGNYNAAQLLEAINTERCEGYDRIFDSPGHYAYLKIAEGCNRSCAFCAIPLFKGNYISRPMNEVVEEANFLAEKGVKEIILIAQDLSYYGYDFDRKFLLPELVESICKIDGIEWVRLHYLYPFLFPEKLIDVIANNPKVCKYIDIPLQHISDIVLKAMNRGGTKQETVELLKLIRNRIPDAAIRTTMLVGHPGEGDAEFEELVEFVKEQRFDRLGVFTYSEEDGTRAAKNFKDEIPLEIKDQRAETLMAVQQQISAELNESKIGKTFKVIIDRQELDYYVGRTEFDSVEVDNEVIINSKEVLSLGQFVDVKITHTGDFELFGEKI